MGVCTGNSSRHNKSMRHNIENIFFFFFKSQTPDTTYFEGPPKELFPISLPSPTDPQPITLHLPFHPSTAIDIHICITSQTVHHSWATAYHGDAGTESANGGVDAINAGCNMGLGTTAAVFTVSPVK